ncbi:MAG: FtsW/RodA/SpoVE family cell cycle protein [Candidatus Coprovivens sp.]
MKVLKRIGRKLKNFIAGLEIKKVFSNLHFPLLILMIIYLVFGLLMIFSASSVAAVLRYQVPSNYFFIRQLTWILLSLIPGFIILFVNTKYYRFFSKWVMLFAVGALILLFAVGVVAGGAKSWYDMGDINIQPTELVKIILIIYLAVYYHRFGSKKDVSLGKMAFPLILAVIVFILVAMQPDFGGAFIIAVITALIFFSLPIAKNQKKTIYKIGIGTIVVALVASLFLGKDIFQSYQVSRLLNFTEPCQRYSDDTGYQVCNGYIAIHNGGLTGVGLGKSTQKYLYLPEAHTDFIFPIICEELGLVVGILVVIGYFVMLFMILNVAKETDTLRNSVLAYGIFAYLLAHILINLLGVLGLIPLTGVPLPFLSYGGSYNMCVIISMFMIQRIHYENKEAKLRKKIENL